MLKAANKNDGVSSEKLRSAEQITSAHENSNATIECIQSLNIMCGCLGIDTLIKMSDASQKKIQDIEFGNKILGADGQPWLVENLWKGFEERIFEIEAGNQSITLTENHPIKVDGEIVMMKDLEIGMLAMFEGGKTAEIVMIKEKKYQNDVYNLDISPINRADDYDIRQHLMLANGFMVGDNILQNNMGR